MCTLHPAVIILVCLASVITAIVIFGNGFILWKLNPLGFRDGRRKKLRGANFDILLSYLAVFDLLAAVTMVPRIYNEVSCYRLWPLGSIGCKLVLPLYDVSINISVCVLVIISVERYRRITMPFKKLKSRRFTQLSVLLSIALSFAVYFERFLTADNINGACVYRRDTSLLNISPLLVLLSRDFVFLTVFTTTSVLIQRFLSTQARRNGVQKDKHEQSRRVFTMLFRMQLVFTVLVLPYDVISCISLGYVMINKQNLPTLDHKSFNLLSGYLYLLQMSNSLANCFIHSKIHRLALDASNSLQKHKSLRSRTQMHCMKSICVIKFTSTVDNPNSLKASTTETPLLISSPNPTSSEKEC